MTRRLRLTILFCLERYSRRELQLSSTMLCLLPVANKAESALRSIAHRDLRMRVGITDSFYLSRLLHLTALRNYVTRWSSSPQVASRLRHERR